MKKIPTLFIRDYHDDHSFTITNKVTPGCEWVLKEEGIATLKIDGSCAAIIDGVFFRRYDAKKGKIPPVGAIPCCDPDPVTGHWPHWIKVDPEDKGAKWYYEAYLNSNGESLPDGTYEVVGPHFRDNPYNLSKDVLERHGAQILDVPRSFEGIKKYLEENYIEGIVFWKDGEPKCKIKRKDFGLPWNRKENKLD